MVIYFHKDLRKLAGPLLVFRKVAALWQYMSRWDVSSLLMRS